MQSSGHVSGQVERVLALRTFGGFARLAPEHLVTLAEYAQEKFYREGAVLAMPNQPPTFIYFIRRGSVHVMRSGFPVRTFGPGSVVGGMAALTQDPSGQHLVAASDTDAFAVHVDDIQEVFEDNFPILLTVMRGMASNVLQTRQRMSGDAGFSREIITEPKQVEKLGLVERILFTRHLMAYGKARVEAIAELARDMKQEFFRKGAVLWEQGDPATYQYLIYTGVVACESKEGQRFAFGANSVVGGIDSMGGVPRWFRATAQTDVVALRSEVSDLIDVIEDHPDMGIDMLRVLARILLDLRARLDEQSIPPGNASSPT